MKAFTPRPGSGESAARWERRAEIIARSFAVCLGGFALLNLVGNWWKPGFDASLWWIDLRWLSDGLAVAVQAGSGVLLLAYGLCPPAPGSRRGRGTLGMAVLLLSFALRDAWGVLQLGWHGQVALRVPVPLSLGVAAGLGLVAWRAWRGPSPALGVRHRVALALMLPTWPAVFALGLMVCFGTTDYRRPASVGVVFGARAYADGRPSDALADRVRTACGLYRSGLVRRLIFSGGPGDGEVHETESMRRMAVQLGVAQADIELDPRGWNTQATVRNTAARLRGEGVGQVLVVSHFYHLPRVQLAYRRAGIEVRTVPAKEEALLAQLPYNLVREVAALWVYFLRS